MITVVLITATSTVTSKGTTQKLDLEMIRHALMHVLLTTVLDEYFSPNINKSIYIINKSFIVCHALDQDW